MLAQTPESAASSRSGKLTLRVAAFMVALAQP
jgi:hypothetical protein